MATADSTTTSVVRGKKNPSNNPSTADASLNDGSELANNNDFKLLYSNSFLYNGSLFSLCGLN